MSKRQTGRKRLLFGKGGRLRLPGKKGKLRLGVGKRYFAVLPTFLTLGNGVCGFGAITFAAQWWGPNLATSLFASSCLIYLAMVFDALDGSSARRLNQTSEFGAQLDSLCDAISFGAAPAFVMLQFSLATDYHPRVLWLIAALYVVCTVLRLARYNVESDEDDPPGVFSGLPSPAAAGTVASFPVMAFGLRHMDTENGLLWDGLATWLDSAILWVLPPIALAVACLMVSRVRYTHTFHYLLRGRRNGPYLIKLVFAVALIFVLPQISVPVLFCWYAFATPVLALWKRRNGPASPRPGEPVPPPDLPDPVTVENPKPSAAQPGPVTS